MLGGRRRIATGIVLMLLLMALSPIPRGEVFARSSGVNPRIAFTVGVNHPRPHFRIDNTVSLLGESVRVFTSRQSDYRGWHLSFMASGPRKGHFGKGLRFAFGSWKVGYWLNRESPDVMSLDPLPAKFEAYYLELGPYLHREWGPFRIAPFVTVPLGHTFFTFSIEDTEANDADFFIGLAGGLETSFELTNALHVSLGYRRMWLRDGTPSYQMGTDLTFTGEFTRRPEELYFGIALQTRN